MFVSFDRPFSVLFLLFLKILPLCLHVRECDVLRSVEIALLERCKHRDRKVNSDFKFVNNYETIKNHQAMPPASQY